MSALAIVTFAATARAGDLPWQPGTFDTSWSPPSGGNVLHVPAGGDFQAALNAAHPGDTIVLQAGATYAGPFTLPYEGGDWAFIYIVSSNYARLPGPGSRVGPADAGNMPILVAPYLEPAVRSTNGSHHFRFVGIEFTNAPGAFTYSLVQLDNGDTSPATLAHDITFDRCFFFAEPTAPGVRRGLLMNGAYIAVKDSYLEGFREMGADNQAIMAYNTTGHLQIVDNYIEAAGENVLFGGDDSASPALVPSDIEVRGNYLFKPLSLLGGPYVVKNLVEVKSASRVLLAGNVLENNWDAAQNGFSVLLTPRNQNGNAPWSIVQDVTISGNLMLNLGSGLNILGTDNINASLETARVLVQNNVIRVTALNGANGWGFEVTGNPTSLTIDHNTVFDVNAFLYAASLPQATAFTFTNNIVQNGQYGLMGQATATGNSSLETFFVAPTFIDNAIIGGRAYLYPGGNDFPADTGAVQFVDAAGGNYALSPSSPYRGAGTDGRDLGADATLLPTRSATAATPTATPAPASSAGPPNTGPPP